MVKKIKKFISHAHDEKIKEYPKAVQDLIKKGKIHKFVTQQEFMKAIPNIESNVLLLDEIYTLFMDIGIEVVDIQDALIWKKEEQAEGNYEASAGEEKDRGKLKKGAKKAARK